MSELQIAWLELGTVGGLGAILIFIGIMINIAAKKKIKLCTHKTEGVVIKYGFPGNGDMYPIVEYMVDGNFYQTRKKFHGVKVTRISGLPIHMQSEAYEDEKGWLHVKIGPIANLRQLAEQLWPINSKMTVYYDPAHPKKSYVERPVSARFISALFMIIGGITFALSVWIFFWIQG